MRTAPICFAIILLAVCRYAVPASADVIPGEMVYIPAGFFLMGNSNVGNDAVYQASYELPQHPVNLSGYYIGKYEVTRGEYGQFMNAGGYTNLAYWSSAGWSWKGSRTEPYYWDAVQDWGTGTFTQTDDHPVVSVSYYEAEAFCNWAGGHLPTEAQWEKAARWTGSYPNVYPWGDTWDQEKCNNWYDTNAAGGGYAKYQTSPVGSYPSGASPYGCMDMAGNVWQWVQDWYKSYPGSSNPFDYTNTYRVLRGGGWANGEYYGRCASRAPNVPGNYSLGNGGGFVGFRLARDAAPTGISLTLSPNQITPGQTVTAAAYAPGATSVALSFSVLGRSVPGIRMTQDLNDTWRAAFSTSFLQAARSGSVLVTAKANTPSGVQTASATLWIGTAPTGPPPSGGGALNIFADDRGAYGLATSSFQVSNPGGNPLTAKLLVQQDLNLWFAVDFAQSGQAQWSAPTGFSVPELMGRCPLGPMVNPCGAVAQMGVFCQPGDTVTFALTPLAGRAAIANMTMILLNRVPGGIAVSPENVVEVLQDFQAIQAVKDAATELFGEHYSSVWQCTKAAGSAVWSLKGLVNDKAQRELLAAALAKVGLTVAEGDLKAIVQGLAAWDLLKIISSEVVFIVQTGGNTINCTFQAYGTSGSGSAPQAVQSMAAAPRTSTAPPPAQTSVTWQTTPSATDWLISYSVANQGTNPVWSFTVFYEPSVGAPTAILDPPGWSHDLDTAAGTVTWYTQGPGGWVNGDFGTAAIAPGNSLSGFGIRHTAPPDYSMCSSTDTGYGSCFGQVPAPAPAQGISAAKMRTNNDEVWLSDKIVTAVFPDGSYCVEDPLRSCGIRVSGGTPPSVGDKVRIVGALAVTNGEAQVNATTCLKVDTGIVRPLGMLTKALGGGSAVGIQQGITGASGLNNIGLLVKTWGKVTLAGRGWFYLDDGSGVNDGSGVIGIYVDAPSMSVPAKGSYATVTGISSCDLFLGNVVNTLRPRSQEDITIVLAP